MGAGTDTESYKDYFSGVVLLDRGGRIDESIGIFGEYGNAEEHGIKDAVGISNYCYMAFEAADGYTLTVSELAFYARAEEAGTLNFEIYKVSELPTKLLNKDGTNTVLPDEYGNTDENDGTDETVFTEENKYGTYSFALEKEWNSRHYDLEKSITVSGGEYIVLRFLNNCVLPNEVEEKEDTDSAKDDSSITGGESSAEEAVEKAWLYFTVNYPMFYFDEAKN